MSRPLAATLAGLLFIACYIVAVITLPDLMGRMHWATEAIYWTIAGLLWTLPIRWLMIWSVQRPR